MGHDPDPAAEARQLRGLIRDAHAAVKDLRAAMREAGQLRPQLVAQFEASVNDSLAEFNNYLQRTSNEASAQLNANVEAARQEIAQRLFDARIEYNEAADNWVIVFKGARFTEDVPLPHPERK